MILGQSLIQVFKSSLIMTLLLVCSITALALIIERFWYFFKNRFNHYRGFAELRKHLNNPGIESALNYARSQKNPLGRLFLLTLENRHLPIQELGELAYGNIIEERVRYERFLGGMGTLANVATLLGLLGTVVGLIRAFHNIAITGSGGPVVVSAGIAEALLTTAFGLFIGIPTLFFYNYYSKKAGDLTMALESTSEKLLVVLERIKETREPTVVTMTRQDKEEPAKDVWRF